ncbi:MAG: cell division protein SepF [Aeriscardovia sp.]|nr:cell division protein SepF [Aeriscardovia sp.]MBQ3308377.1 cell division protein SepF [Aeriscardovia sp.]MBQ3480631.1 cell division protein SepF [Aeriscardovia sp.]MBR2673411.1 cell division protein SepF [Aeriscardovia sp.]
MGRIKDAMSYLGMADVSEADVPQQPDEADIDAFDAQSAVAAANNVQQVAVRQRPTYTRSQLSRITTIHPKSYDDAQLVGRSIREGIPVVLNLTDVSESVAYRIVDFSAGVVFGLRGSIERVTPRVFLLSPAQVSISVEDNRNQSAQRDPFAD